ncbi:YdcF family protein [Lichenihabitans psoromatis]|uniref:YdcF family protein n=1 Tax=Lichenihabitans psoromatis TaxID=2528642 RepID=UPI00103554D2|nr:YdcF family protein [Lichenihabitans psoromatis]
MFFLVSKLLWVIAAPVTLMVLVALGGALLSFSPGRFARVGRRVALAGTVLLLAGGVLPVGTLLLRPLEDRFPQPPADLPAPTGIIVLGGSIDQTIAASRGRITISDAADRMTEAVILGRRYPDARLVFTGGANALAGSALTEAADARRLWIEMGIAPERITTEDRSRNTDENARFTKAILQPQPGERWLLVTSAYHMPRAIGLFRANGFPVIPYPVDYRTLGTDADIRLHTDIANGLVLLNTAAHEWMGLLAYAIAGKTETVLPRP